MKNRYRAS